MDLELPSEGVDVWIVSLGVEEQMVVRCRRLLTPDEQQRAANFGAEERACQYVLTRGLLRLLLSRYLGIPAETVTLDYGVHGKPQLAHGANDLQFNVSESAGLAAFAFARGSPVGIDVERGRPIERIDDLAARFLHPGERQDLAALPLSQLLPAFFNCWTRKEAYVKALGQGLLTELDSFRVTVAPDRPAEILVASPGEASQDWHLHSFQPAAGFYGAVAYRGPVRSVLSRTIPLSSLVRKA